MCIDKKRADFRFMTVRDAAYFYCLPYWKVAQAVRVGLIPSYRLGNSRRYIKDVDLLAAMNRFGGREE